MEAGLRLAGDMFRELRHRGAERRVLLLTDAQPNTGATTPGAFLELATDLSTRGIGLTVVGVGMGLNPGVMEAMLSLKGGNGFGIATAEAVPEFMEENWPWCVCPIASDLSVDVTPAPGFTVDRGYGFPGEDTELRAASVFLSRKRGALAVRLAGATPNDLGATVNLSYRDRQGNERGQTLVLDLPDGAEPDEHGRTFTQYGTGKMTALALLTDALHEAAELYLAEREESLAIMARAVERFAVDVDALRGENPADVPALETELAFAEAMQALMIEGARQGDLYGGF